MNPGTRAMRALSRRLAWLLTLLVGWLASAQTAAAAPPLAHFSWTRPVQSQCPTAAMLEDDVEAVLGRRAFTRSADAADLLVRGEIREVDGLVRARLEAKTRDGESLGVRELTAQTEACASLRRTLGFVLALVLDQDLPETATTRAATFYMGPAVAASAGSLPRVAPGVGLSLSVAAHRRVTLHADALYWFPVAVETSRGLGATFQGLSGAVLVCPAIAPDRRTLQVGLCGGLHTTALFASPRRLDGPRRAVRVLPQGVLSLALRARLGEASFVEANLGPTLAFARPRYSLTRAGGGPLEVHRPALLGGFLRLALIMTAL